MISKEIGRYYYLSLISLVQDKLVHYFSYFERNDEPLNSNNNS